MPRGAALRAVRAVVPRTVLPPAAASRNVHAGAQRLLHVSSRRAQEVLATAAKLPEAEPIPVKKSSDRITINDILDRRAKAGKLVAGTAAPSNSDMFKAPVCYLAF